MTQPNPSPAGVIHDLAYRRYEGARLGASTRFTVIARYAVQAQWRLRAVRLFVVGALVCAALGAAAVGVNYGFRRMMHGVGADGLDMDLTRDAAAVSYALAAQYLPTLLLVLVCGAPAVAADLNAGAFQFHFARTVTPGQYLLGRFAGALTWPALFGYGTVALYAVERLVFVEGVGTSLKLMAVGALAVTLRLATLGAVALGCSSLTRRRGLAQAMFLATVLGSGMVTAIAASSTSKPWIATLSVMDAGTALCDSILGPTRLHGVALAAPAMALALWITVFTAVAWWRVRSAEVVRG